MSRSSINDRRLRRAASRAVRAYDLLPEGHRVLVAVSGGVDSMVCLHVLHRGLLDPPPSCSIHVAHVDTGFGAEAPDGLARWCASEGLPFELLAPRHGPEMLRAHGDNACFRCARTRRRLLFEAARRLGCQAVALGHTQDDMVETLWMNQIWSAEISTILPRQELFDGALSVIRPLYLVEKRFVRRFAREHHLPVWENPCPMASTSRRAQVREILAALTRRDRRLRKNLARAAMNVNPTHLPRPPKERTP